LEPEPAGNIHTNGKTKHIGFASLIQARADAFSRMSLDAPWRQSRRFSAQILLH
jgi:hypothetical protein